MQKMPGRDRRQWRVRGALKERYLDVVSESVGVPRERLRPDADFVDDLRLDYDVIQGVGVTHLRYPVRKA
jgi:hypothetical protein